MQHGNDADEAIREGEPPLIPRTPDSSQQDLPRQPEITWLLKCLWPVALGSLFSGCTATSMIPESIGVADRVLVFVAMMAGPFCGHILLSTSDFSHSPIAIWQMLGFLSVPLIAAYPVKQSMVAACLSVVGLAFWLLRRLGTSAFARDCPWESPANQQLQQTGAALRLFETSRHSGGPGC